MRLKPVITEKSMSDAKNKRYTFYVPTDLNKNQIRKLISETFDVTVKSVRTINSRLRTSKNLYGKIKTIKATKKAIVTVGEKDKIDLFETKSDKK